MRSYVLVSGGAGGIGSALCRLLPTLGYTPIAGYRNGMEQAETLVKACGGFALQIDLASDDSISRALSRLTEVLQAEDRLAAVVLAASPPPELLPFGKLTPELLMHQFRINVAGPQMLLSGIIKNHFRKEKAGTVVGVLSEATGNAERPPVTGMGAYVIAKDAQRSLLKVCATEYPWLRVRTVSPGFTETPMLSVFDERYLEQMRAKAPFATPDDVAMQIAKELLP